MITLKRQVNLFRLKQENRCLGDQGVDGDQFNFNTLEKTYSCAGTPKIKAKNSFSLQRTEAKGLNNITAQLSICKNKSLQTCSVVVNLPLWIMQSCLTNDMYDTPLCGTNVNIKYIQTNCLELKKVNMFKWTSRRQITECAAIMRTALFWVIMRWVVVIPYWHFGTEGSRILTFEDGTERLSQDISKKLPLQAA